MEDAADFQLNALNFQCYPFSDELVDPALIPVTNPYGKVPWATDDVYLDYKTKLGLTGDSIGWDDIFLEAGRNVQATFRQEWATGFKTGWQVRRLTKPDFASYVESAAFGPAINPGASPIWNRVTSMNYTVDAALSTTTSAYYLANIWFGPQPGKWRRLRPYEYTTDMAWSVDSKPALGLYNPTDRRAMVRIAYASAE